MSTTTLTRDDRLTLGHLTTRDESGRHFTERYSGDWLARMESAELIAIDRPVHDPTGIPYGESHWDVEVSPEVAEWFDAYGNLVVED